MRILPSGGFVLALVLTATALAQETSLTRSEVAALKAKLVAVQQAMGADPSGYLKEEESFDLPTDANPAQGGKFWPITSGVTLRYTDRASTEGQANAEKAAEEFQAKYAAAAASGNVEALTKMMTELQQIQAAAMAPAVKKEDMQVYVQFNQNPIVGIDPDAVVLEQPGVIALRDKEVSSEKGNVTVYIDPVALKATQELSKIELRTADDGVSNKTGVFHIVIQMNGAVADIEAWVMDFDFGAMLGVIDPR
ncbi:MAG TPA: hypothetical protein VFB99_23600 [Vicinamibacterales bacterium]|nr:hypothetical protein [Vicinamibacterales bacterium]